MQTVTVLDDYQRVALSSAHRSAAQQRFAIVWSGGQPVRVLG